MTVVEAEAVEVATTPEAEQVERGAAWLDEHYPGWEDRVDLTRLDLMYCEKCVVGQAVAPDNGWGYWNTMAKHELYMGDERRLGFAAADKDDYGAWERLTEAWRDEIVRRRFSE